MVELKNPGPIEFEGVIKSKQMRNNLAEWVDFPYDLKETYGKGNLVPVKVTFDGRVKYQGSLAKMGGPKAMILLRSDIKAQLGKGGGDKVKVKVELDPKERKVTLAKDVATALKKAGLTDVYKSFSYSHQREWNTWIEDAKKPETRTRRIEKVIAELRAQTKS